MKPYNLKSAVQRILFKYPSARDNDVYLYTWLCNDEWQKDLHSISAIDLLQMIDVGKFPRFDSVSRLRREVQNENPELRGSEWALRHKEAERIAQEKAIGNRSF
jgi:hypothetical protein